MPSIDGHEDDLQGRVAQLEAELAAARATIDQLEVERDRAISLAEDRRLQQVRMLDKFFPRRSGR
jgi:multidrug resistance efflux pump